MKYQRQRSFYEAEDETQKCHPERERIKTGPSNIIGRSDAESKKSISHERERGRPNSIITLGWSLFFYVYVSIARSKTNIFALV